MELPPIVTPEWAAAHRDDIVVVHVATGDEPQLLIAGAVAVDRDRDLAAPASAAEGRHPLPTPEHFAAALGRAGIAAGDAVVAYDGGDGSVAARLVWMLRILGQPAALLDGGLRSWPGPTATAPSHRPPTTVARRAWPADRIATADEVAAAIATGVPVVDARSAERWRGEVEPLDPVPGRIPGSANVPFTDNLDPATGRFRELAAVRAAFEAAGVREGRDAIASCGSGVTACHDALAMEAAGLGTPRVYVGSYSQWCNDPSRPIGRGEGSRQR